MDVVKPKIRSYFPPESAHNAFLIPSQSADHIKDRTIEIESQPEMGVEDPATTYRRRKGTNEVSESEVDSPENSERIIMGRNESSVRSKIPILSPRFAKNIDDARSRKDESEHKSSKLARELKRLADINKPGLKQSDVNDVPSKRKSKLRK